jgi:Bax protein
LPEDFSKIVASSKKKSLFVRSILPLIVKENNRIETLNNRVKNLKNNFSKINRSEAMWLDKMMSSYKVKSNDINDLIIKVDIIPVSIALGQAAIESGWGTSRFAMEGNALYGQWSWKTGSGIVPKERDVNEVYEIKSFLSLSNSVASYMKNLNTHQNYKNFRTNRKLLREHNIPVLGSYLYQYLDKYAVDSNYSNTLKKIIDSNKFEELENVEIQFMDTEPSLLNLT